MVLLLSKGGSMPKTKETKEKKEIIHRINISLDNEIYEKVYQRAKEKGLNPTMWIKSHIYSIFND